MSSRDPRINAFPMSLNVDAVQVLFETNHRELINQEKRTLLNVTTEIHDFAANSGVKEVSYLLLRTIIPGHDYDELGSCSCGGRTEYRRGDEVCRGYARDEVVQLDYRTELSTPQAHTSHQIHTSKGRIDCTRFDKDLVLGGFILLHNV